jgi:hypothetical protein
MGRRRERGGPVRGVEVESPMGPAAVVVAGVCAQDSFEVVSAAHKRPVQALRSDRSDPSLGEGVGSRSPVRGPDDVHSFRAEDLVERPGRRVPIADEKAHRLELGLDNQVPGLLGDPCGVGMGCGADEIDPSGVKINEEQDVEGLSRIVSTVKKSVARTPCAWARRPKHPVSLTAGWRTCELPGPRADRVSVPHRSSRGSFGSGWLVMTADR